MDFINKKDWSKITLSTTKMIIKNGKYLIHYAGLSNDIELFKKIVENKGNILQTDNNGDTIGHISARLGYYELLKLVLTENSHIINKVNDYNESILHILSDNYEMLKYIFDNYKNINIINKENDNGNTVLLLNTIKNHNKDIIKLLISNGANLNCPLSNPPLIEATNIGNEYLVKLYIKNGANINALNKDYINAFIVSVGNKYSNITKYLLYSGADPEYNGVNADTSPLMMSMIMKNYDIINTLLKYKVNVNQHNRYLFMPAHIMFNKDLKIPFNIKEDILKKTDNLQFQDINGNTVLHYLFKNDNWLKYKDILLQKKININIKNKEGIAPSKYITQKKDLTLLLKHNSKEDANDIKILKYAYSNKSFFSASLVYNIIYTIIILQKYSNLSIPYINKQSSNNSLIINNNNKTSKVVHNIIKMYHAVAPKLLHYIIVWSDINNYYISDVLGQAIKNNKHRFIFMRLSLVVNTNLNHANVIIYDKKLGTVERFDPYGNVPYIINTGMDKFFESHFKKIIDPNIIYIGPSDYMDNVGFQVISDEGNIQNKKFGDPAGYCLAWTYWYIETRMNNQNVDIKTLYTKSIKKINNTKLSFMEYIRNYANFLNLEKDKFFKKAMLNKKYWYSEVHTNENIKKIINHIKLELNSLLI